MKTFLPVLVWVALLFLAGRHFLLEHWEGALVLFAALALVPPGLGLLRQKNSAWYWLSAAGLGAAYLLFPNQSAPLLALPYLLWAVWLSVQKLLNLLIFRQNNLAEWVRLAALAYWATGALWAWCFLAGIQPLGFDPVITGLTAAHFHVAGFVLTVAVYCLYTDTPDTTNRILAWVTLAGMPLVAAGITLTKSGYSAVFEEAFSLGFVAFAWAVLYRHIRLAFNQKYPRPARLYWLGGAVCLLAGGALAALYALRFSFPLSRINIPNMKIWHGTLNAIGFGWPVLLGWNRVLRKP